MDGLIKINGRWYSDFTYKGKRIRRFLSRYKDEAKVLLPELKRKIKGELPPAGSSMSWREFKERFMEYALLKLNHSTVEKYRRAFALVEAYDPPKLLSEMTPERLEGLEREWLKHTSSHKGIKWGDTSRIGLQSVYISVRFIKAAMRWAEDRRYVPLQNWRIIKVPETPGRMIHYSPAEFERLIKVCEPPYRMLAMLQGRAGLRFGEAWNLDWKDIEWHNHRIHIYSRPGWHIKGDRTGRYEKWIPLEADLEAFLRKHRKPSGHLIQIRGYGERMSEKRFQTKMTGFIRKAKLNGSGHALRHTYASLMVSNGATLPEVGAVLGHKDPRVTQIYAHLSEQAKARTVSRLPRLKFKP